MKVTDKRSSALCPDPPPPGEVVPLLIAGATQAQVVRPGDSLLLVFEQPLQPDRMQQLIWNFAKHHPDMQVIIIDGAQATVIRGETADAEED